MDRNTKASVPRCWNTLVRNLPTPGTPMAKSASLCSANSFTCRGVMICSASAFSSSGLSGCWRSCRRSPATRMVGGRPTLRCRSEPPCLTISVMAALKLNGDASAIGIHPEQDLSEFDRLGVLDGNLANDARQLRVERVHDLHRFDDAQRLPHADPAAHPHIRVRSRLGARVEGPHHGGLHFEPVPPLVLHTTGGRSGRGGSACRSCRHRRPPRGGGGGGGGVGGPRPRFPPPATLRHPHGGGPLADLDGVGIRPVQQVEELL